MKLLGQHNWIIHTCFVVLGCTAAFTAMKIGMGHETTPFLYACIMSASTCAAHLVSVVIFKIKSRSALTIQSSCFIAALLIGVALFLNNAASVLMFFADAPISLAMPISNTGIVVASVIVGVFFLRERMTRKQIFGLGLSVLGIVLLNV